MQGLSARGCKGQMGATVHCVTRPSGFATGITLTTPGQINLALVLMPVGVELVSRVLCVIRFRGRNAMSELNGIPLSPWTARLMFLPVSHLMKHTLMACPIDEVPEHFRDEYAKDIWGPEKAAAMNKWLSPWPLGIPVAREPLFRTDLAV